MNLLKKHTWKGLTVAVVMLLSVGLMTKPVSAAVTSAGSVAVDVAVTAVTGGSAAAATAMGNITLTSTATTDFAAGTIILTAPTGWVFAGVAVSTPLAGSTIRLSGNGDGVAGTTTTAAATVTLTVSTAGVGTIIVSALTVQPSTLTSVPGDITLSGTSGLTGTAASIGNGSIYLGLTTNLTSVPSDSVTAATLSIKVRGTTGVMVPNVIVSLTTSKGTLSSSSLTATSAVITTGTTSLATNAFRGAGATGLASITATSQAPNAAIATLNTINIVGSAQAPVAVKFLTASASGHIGASSTTVYTSSATVSKVRFQVQDSVGGGVNTQLISATVDKGYIQAHTVSGTTGAFNENALTACAGSAVTASMIATTVTIDTVDTDGIAAFTVCARVGQVGTVKITAKDLSTIITEGTASLVSSGVPSAVTAVVTGNSIVATVKDKDGNEAPDNTVVQFLVPSSISSVSPTCALTTNGKAIANAAFPGGVGDVIVSVFVNNAGTGTAAACTAGAPSADGNTVAASTVASVKGGSSTSTAGGKISIGTKPAAGKFGLLGVSRTTTVADFLAELKADGTSVESIAVASSAAASGWNVYIPGAPSALVQPIGPTSPVEAGGVGVKCAAAS